MSIFPKRVTKNDNVIIHLKFINESSVTSCFDYITQVISPSGKIVKDWSDQFIMAPKNGEGINQKEQYYEINKDLLNEAGKYTAKTSLYINGRIINSSTEKNDYFYVDDITYKIKSKNSQGKCCYLLTNNSLNSDVPFSLITDSGEVINTGKIAAGKTIEVNSIDRLQLKYANNSIMMATTSSRYIKNKRYDYRIINNCLQLFDDNTMELITLPNTIAFIWIKCNGIHTIDDLSAEAGLSKKITKNIIEMLLNNNYISEVL